MRIRDLSPWGGVEVSGIDMSRAQTASERLKISQLFEEYGTPAVRLPPHNNAPRAEIRGRGARQRGDRRRAGLAHRPGLCDRTQSREAALWRGGPRGGRDD